MSDVFSYDPSELKQSLVAFMQTKPEFADFNYEGSAINTMIDLLTRNTHYIAYMANMVGTESFLDSAQLRANIVSHAQKLSYVPKSRTASTMVVDIEVIPSTAPAPGVFSITAPKGTTFINTIENVSYSFVTTNEVVLTKNIQGRFVASSVELKQGQLLRQQFLVSTTGKIELSNKDIDTSTVRVFVKASQTSVEQTEYQRVNDITDIDSDSRVFYLSENTFGNYDVEFGKGVLGFEPQPGSIVTVESVLVEKEHANGLDSLVAASPIDVYSNIRVQVQVEAFGGAERSSNEYIKFLAPRTYEAQNRAVREQDYSTIAMREFPFIKSANSWGGEKNVPPYYGKVFICAIPQEGFVIADTVKSNISERIRRFSMMSAEVVDPIYLGVTLNIGVIFNADSTVDTFAQTIFKIQTEVQKYNDELKTFNLWFNNSLLVQRIKTSVPAAQSLEIEKTIFQDHPIVSGRNERYSFQFVNKVKPGSLMSSAVVIDSLATSQIITDDGEGRVIKKVTKGGVVIVDDIGTINYETGQVEFAEQFINSGTLRITVSPSTNNVYTERNFVIVIDDTQISRITERVA